MMSNKSNAKPNIIDVSEKEQIQQRDSSKHMIFVNYL